MAPYVVCSSVVVCCFGPSVYVVNTGVMCRFIIYKLVSLPCLSRICVCVCARARVCAAAAVAGLLSLVLGC